MTSRKARILGVDDDLLMREALRDTLRAEGHEVQAVENAARLGVELVLVCTNLLDGIDGPFDLVVSNPPYVGRAEVDTLPPEVRDWEPRAALLDEGQTEALARAVESGWLVLEVHEERAPEAAALLAGLGYERIGVTDDLAGRPRVVEGRR